MTVYILGGGPAGLAVVHGLDGKSPFVLLERGKTVGGLAQTLKWGEHGSHDLGPHKLFTKDAALMRRVEALLPPSEWLTRPKSSSIYMRGHYLPYPPSPFSLANVYGPAAFAGMLRDYGVARVQGLMNGSTAPTSFAEDLEARVGKSLYRYLFEPIALKLWGDPTELDVKLSQGRVQTPKISELVLRLLRIRTTSEFEALTFRYPRGGLQRLWNAITTAAAPHGQILTDQEILRIEVTERRVRRIVCKSQTFELGPDDFVFSTLPIGVLVRLLADALSPGTPERVKKTVQLNDLYLCFFKVDRPSLLAESWIFIPDPAIVMHRISEQESFDPEMTGDGSIVCCEIMGNDSRKTRGMSDAELLAASERGLHDMGYRAFKIFDRRVIRLPASYPVYRPNYESELKAILGELDALDNLKTIGRQGSFNYIGTLDAMDIGFGAARWLLERAKSGTDTWREERQRTDHYPVLD